MPAAGVMVAAEVATKIEHQRQPDSSQEGPCRNDRQLCRRCCNAAVALTLNAQSADPWIGTWKVNLEKSTYSPGPKPTTAWTINSNRCRMVMKRTFDGMNPEGKPFHIEPVGAFDGNDYPVKVLRFRIRPRRTSASTAERLKR